MAKTLKNEASTPTRLCYNPAACIVSFVPVDDNDNGAFDLSFSDEYYSVDWGSLYGGRSVLSVSE